MSRFPLALAGCLALAAAAPAQDRFLLADRNNDAIYLVRDLNHNGVIDEPAEVFLWFNATNTAGTPGLMNPSAMAARRDGVCVLGDQQTQTIYRFQDQNGDNDALDPGESRVLADASNASGVSLAFPTGIAFDSFNRLYVVNAGNAFGPDAIYRFVDLNQDGDMQDAGEITVWAEVGPFGGGNGPYSPQELFFDGNNDAYVRNSSATLQGFLRLHDANSDGDADDPGESTIFYSPANASGVPVTAGFAVDPINRCMPDFYMLQLATGGVDQLVRVSDWSGDHDAQDASPNEARLVWSTAQAGFTSIDLLVTISGTVLITDNSGKKVYQLIDNDSDGAFTSAGEQTVFFNNTLLIVGDIRQIAAILCTGDVDLDGDVDLSDLAILLANFGRTGGAMPSEGDVDGDCDVDLTDLALLLSRFGSPC